MAIGADQGQIVQLRLLAGAQLRDRLRVVALHETDDERRTLVAADFPEGDRLHLAGSSEDQCLS